jgi:pimeloyl-ACP methyl ester carboxylesterase
MATLSTPRPRSPSFFIVAMSLAIGLVLPILLALGPASGGGESRMIGAALLAWGIGWGLIAVLSSRFTDRRQDWAFFPAVIFSVAGVALIAFAPGSRVMDMLAWVWPVPLLVLVAWLVMRVRRNVVGPARWLLYPVLAVLALLAIGGASETVVEATDGGRSADGGELVDVGGHRLFIECAGTGSPTVVLESGLGQGATYWARIAPVVAATTRVCAYDRAGRGRSEVSSTPQDGPAIARDLHALLSASGNVGPYILVGHSSGAVYVRFFEAAYPSEVTGMVLLDSQAQDPAATPDGDVASAAGAPSTLAGILPALARVGLVRLVTSGATSDLPAAATARRHAEEATAHGAASFGEEFMQLGAISAAARRDLPNFGDRPLVVVTAMAQASEGWLALQDRLATLSTDALHRVLVDVTHDGLIETPSGAAAASEAIQSVVASLRSGAQLDGSPR